MDSQLTNINMDGKQQKTLELSNKYHEEWAIVPYEDPKTSKEHYHHNEKWADFSSHFVTDEIFRSRELVIKWCQAEGEKLNMVLVMVRSELGTVRSRARFTLGCERGGKYRENINKKSKDDKFARSTGSKKIGCPFSIKGISFSGDRWKLNVECGKHNHDLEKILTGHAYIGRLNSEEVETVNSMTDMGVCPKMVLSTLKKFNPLNYSTRKTIYNARAKYRQNKLQGLSCMQYTLQFLKDSNYVYFVNEVEERNVITHIFMCNPESLMLLKCFPHVLIVDCTYKTNKYKLPLCEFVGIASTGQSFNVGFIFMENEKQTSYEWALDRLKTLIDPDKQPSLFVTDKETSLINAIEVVFPNARRILCKWHVSKNIVSNCKNTFETNEEWQSFMDSWKALADVAEYDQFDKDFLLFEKTWKNYPKAVAYIRSSWYPLKQYFVSAWTNKIKHFGNTTTQRAEGAHSTLKDYVKAASGSFPLVMKAMDDMIRNQIVEIDASFQISKIRPKHVHVKDPTLNALIGQISQLGMGLIFEEKQRAVEFIFINVDNCGCVLRSAYGLPCAHEIASYIRRKKPIPLSTVDNFWRQLSREISKENKIGLDLELDIINPIRVMWVGSEEHIRALKRKILEIVEATTTVVLEPDQKLKNKGRPKKSKNAKKKISQNSTKREPSGFEYAMTMEEEKLSQASVTTKKRVPTKPKQNDLGTGTMFLNRIPELIQPFVRKITNVPSDGHCGFHVMALGLEMNDKDSHFQVRWDLLEELKMKRVFYEGMWGSKEVIKLEKRIRCFESVATQDNWMDLLYCGVLAANWYNRFIYFISEKGCTSFLPMFTSSETGFKKKSFGLALIVDHFIYVQLKPGSPIPPVDPHWEHNHMAKANGWLRLLQVQLETWGEMIWKHEEPIIVDLTK